MLCSCDEKKVPRQKSHQEFTVLHHTKHEELHKRFELHLAYPAGAAVFWDWRLPHRNAKEHNGSVPREVVYTGFLPDIPLNRQYVIDQLKRSACRRAVVR